MKGNIPVNWLQIFVKLYPLHFACNTAFQGTIRNEFETQFTSLSYCHPRDINVTPHKFATKEDAGSRIMRSRGISFVPSDAACIVLNLIPDGVSASIYKFDCGACGLLTRTTSRALEGVVNWLQASFTAR